MPKRRRYSCATDAISKISWNTNESTFAGKSEKYIRPAFIICLSESAQRPAFLAHESSSHLTQLHSETKDVIIVDTLYCRHKEANIWNLLIRHKLTLSKIVYKIFINSTSIFSYFSPFSINFQIITFRYTNQRKKIIYKQRKHTKSFDIYNIYIYIISLKKSSLISY